MILRRIYHRLFKTAVTGTLVVAVCVLKIFTYNVSALLLSSGLTREQNLQVTTLLNENITFKIIFFLNISIRCFLHNKLISSVVHLDPNWIRFRNFEDPDPCSEYVFGATNVKIG